jgi:O-antigen/teichoic acid export membrane protein
MRKEESLVSNYLVNAISTVVNFAFPFMMGYFLMRKLMPDGYGVFSYMLS